MSFFEPKTQQIKDGICIYPKFGSRKLSDFMIRGKSFYAVWDEKEGLWSKEESSVWRIVDEALDKKKSDVEAVGMQIKKMYYMSMHEFKDTSASQMYSSWLKGMYDSYHMLDENVVYLSQPTTIKDYASKRLPYDLDKENVPAAYNELMDTLYDKFERRKLEWAVGAILNGDARYIQKMMVLYGPPGSGKSTFLHIVEQLLEGYWTTFDAKSLTNGKNEFATHFFKDNPLVAIQHDGQLNKIEDNSLLNSIVSHEDVVVNEKFKAQYVARSNCMLFLGTNSPVKISDAKSGLIRRIIDVSPSGRKLDPDRYFALMERIPFELGAIAWQCIKVYRHFGKKYYDPYRPLQMMYATDVFFNFISDNRIIFEKDDPIDLQRIWSMYKNYCEECNAPYISQRYKFRDELVNYYDSYDKKTFMFSGFKSYLLDEDVLTKDDDEKTPGWLTLDKTKSCLDALFGDCPAQYANDKEIPTYKWDNVKTKLSDLDTTKLHYVKGLENHIFIDFDLKNEKGEKDAIRNIQAADKFPPTYAEYSKGGAGIHLHYIYDGDVSRLSSVYSEGIEIKTFVGNSSLRRKLSYCNDLDVAHISTGLPLKEDKKVINKERFENEVHLRNVIVKCLKKEVHANTKPNMDYIKKILDDAYNSGMHYDVRDMRQKIFTFAMSSTNHSNDCIKMINDMKFCSEDLVFPNDGIGEYKDDRLVFFDCEIFPNLFIVCWKYQGTEDCVRMINPTPAEIGQLFSYKLVGYNNRRYDNHILYARYLGYTEEELFKLSGRIINQKRSDSMFREAYNISYTDVYDFLSAGNKKGLKKWEIELDLPHIECPYPWDEPVDESVWDEITEYCCNDVKATESVFDHCSGDWKARLMLAKLADATPNHTTNELTTRIIFGKDRNPQLVYTDLSTGNRSDGTHDDIYWPHYKYIDGRNYLGDEEVGRGGYVWATPGIYNYSVTFDVRSMHPSSLIAMNYFGKYTERFAEIVNARALIKHKDFDAAKKILNGLLAPYLEDPSDAKDVSNALKTAINSVYGLTSASFENVMRHRDNVNNIVALRGALFMCSLKDALQRMGVKIFHVKTDSLKVANPTPEVVDYILEYGKKHGYDFEVEHRFEKICLVNDAIYIAKLAQDDPEDPGQWTATGAQFAEPYVFKTLFSHEDLTFKDLQQTKSVKDSAMYLNTADGNYVFVGRTGAFVPVTSSEKGGTLLVKRDEKYDAVNGTKGYLWQEAEIVKMNSLEEYIDMSYYHSLADKAKDAINKFGDFERFAE